MFISGGENVYPAEIEGALAGHVEIAERAVVGVTDERWGEIGHLVMVAKPNVEIDIPKIAAYLEERLARYKISRRFSVMTQLPRNGAGKLMKSELRAILNSGRLEA